MEGIPLSIKPIYIVFISLVMMVTCVPVELGHNSVSWGMVMRAI